MIRKNLRKRSRTSRCSRSLNDHLDYNTLEAKMLLATIDVIAAGVTGEEQINLTIDGQVVQTWNNLGGDAYEGTYVTLSHSTPGTVSPGQVRIEFTNDLYDPANNFDRNVRIDAIVIDGSRFESEHPNVFSTGTWLPEDGIVPGFRQNEFLHTNGYFQYAELGGSGSVIQVRASGDRGEEIFELQIDQQTEASFAVTENFEIYQYQADSIVTPDQIRIVFTNDQYDPANGIDRNLIVDFISVDGGTFETEDPTVFSTGTWKSADGITPGFRESETLHANGYFEFGQILNYGDISLATSVIDVTESDTEAQFTIVRNNGSDGTVTVDYRTVEITAADGEDYVGQSGTATFLDGETFKTISVPLIDDGLIESNEQFSFTIDNVSGGANLLVPRTATATIDDNDSIVGAGDGLLGEYFDEPGFASRFINRVDPTVNFDWGAGAPAGGMGANTFSVRWTGEIEPLYSETYTFQTTTDDGVRLWVDGQLIIDQWVDQSATTHAGNIDLVAGQLYDIRMEYFENGGSAVAQLAWSSPSQVQEVVPSSQLYSADPPPPTPGDELETQILYSGFNKPTAIEFTPDGTKMLIAEQRGLIYVAENGNLLSTPFLDFRDRVNGTRDRGLLDIAIHPDFENTPYVYLLYTYDPPEVFNQQSGSLAGPDGRGNRAGRLTRVMADPNTNFTTVVPGSEVVLIGNNSTWDNFNGFANSTSNFNEPPAGILPDGSNLQDFIATDSESHTIGGVEFGPDGALYVSVGDGTSYNQVDPRTVRVQDIDNLSGKILRVNPITGEGLPDNPFFNGDADANRSKVYQYGLRNPFRISVHPVSGQVYIGDVGWTQWEEVNAAGPGANFGWPYYEGASGTNSQTNGYRNLPEAQAFYASGEVATPAIFALNHAASGINAIILGDVYTGNAFPAEYQGDLFFNDLGQGIVRNISFDGSGNITSVDTFATGAAIVVHIIQGPDDNLYFVDLNDNSIGRWVFVDQGGSNAAATVSIDAPLIQTPELPVTGNGVTVAIIDSGVDFGHSELAGSRWVNTDEIASDGIDNDGNGYVDDRFGYNFVNNNSDAMDLNGHGTFMAGVLAGSESGYAPDSNIMSLKVLDAAGQGTAVAVANAVRYAVDNGADVIAIPLEMDANAALSSAIQHASEQNVFVVFAAGNDGNVVPAWLADLSVQFSNVMIAGATSIDGSRLPESNQAGSTGATLVDAPGIAYGLQPDNGHATYRGTSVAASHLAAAAANALAGNPNLTANQLRDLITATLLPAGLDSDATGQVDFVASAELAVRSEQVVTRVEGDRIYVTATDGDDNIVVDAGNWSLTINGIGYELPDQHLIDRLVINGIAGSDRLTMLGTVGQDRGWIQTGMARLNAPHQTIVGNQFEWVNIFGGDGFDRLTMYDTTNSEELLIDADAAVLSGEGLSRAGYSFENIRVVSLGGDDSVQMIGTDADDRFFANTNVARISRPGYVAQANQFGVATVELGSGFDPVVLYGSGSSESLVVTPSTAQFTGEGFDISVTGVERTTSNAGDGDDSLTMIDRADRDVVNSRPFNTLMVGVGYDHRAYGYETTVIQSSGGDDRATLTTSGAGDAFNSGQTSVRLSGTNYTTRLNGFPTVLAISVGADESAVLSGSDENDSFYFSPSLANFVNVNSNVSTLGFSTTTATGGGGVDSATFVDGIGDDQLTLRADRVTLTSDDYFAMVREFESVTARSLIDNGTDTIRQIDEQLDYLFESFGDWEV